MSSSTIPTKTKVSFKNHDSIEDKSKKHAHESQSKLMMKTSSTLPQTLQTTSSMRSQQASYPFSTQNKNSKEIVYTNRNTISPVGKRIDNDMNKTSENNKKLNTDHGMPSLDSDGSIQIPRNINNYRHLYDTGKLNDKDIGWVLNLRNHDASFMASTFKTEGSGGGIENPPRFFNEDLNKFKLRKQTEDQREKERRIYTPNLTQNNLFCEHLLKHRLGPSANQTQIFFETTLRTEPDLTIPSGRHPKRFKKFKPFVNKKFIDLPNNGIELDPVYTTPKNEKFIDQLDKLKEPQTGRDLVVRDISYNFQKSQYEQFGKMYYKELEFSRTRTKPFLGEGNSMPIYNENYGRVGFDTTMKTHKHCQNSMLHFAIGLRSQSKQLIRPKAMKRIKRVIPFSPKNKFWIGNGPTKYNNHENLVVKIP